MIVRDATPGDIAHVVHHMREADAIEVFALRFTRDRDALAADMIENRAARVGLLCLARDDGLPVALVGAALAAPKCLAVTMIATDAWPSIAREATRYTRETLMPAYLKGMNRAECQPWEGNAVAIRWLEFLGFKPEGRRVGVGQPPVSTLYYAWRDPDVLEPPPMSDPA